MVNGLNILPSYLDYFDLNTATIGLQTSSVFIGGCLAGVSWGKVTDALGRRPALFWAAFITIVAVILQTAAQDIAMFVVARILIGFGTSASGLTGPAYLVKSLVYPVLSNTLTTWEGRNSPSALEGLGTRYI